MYIFFKLKYCYTQRKQYVCSCVQFETILQLKVKFKFFFQIISKIECFVMSGNFNQPTFHILKSNVEQLIQHTQNKNWIRSFFISVSDHLPLQTPFDESWILDRRVGLHAVSFQKKENKERNGVNQKISSLTYHEFFSNTFIFATFKKKIWKHFFSSFFFCVNFDSLCSYFLHILSLFSLRKPIPSKKSYQFQSRLNLMMISDVKFFNNLLRANDERKTISLTRRWRTWRTWSRGGSCSDWIDSCWWEQSQVTSICESLIRIQFFLF